MAPNSVSLHDAAAADTCLHPDFFEGVDAWVVRALTAKPPLSVTDLLQDVPLSEAEAAEDALNEATGHVLAAESDDDEAAAPAASTTTTREVLATAKGLLATLSAAGGGFASLVRFVHEHPGVAVLTPAARELFDRSTDVEYLTCKAFYEVVGLVVCVLRATAAYADAGDEPFGPTLRCAAFFAELQAEDARYRALRPGGGDALATLREVSAGSRADVVKSLLLGVSSASSPPASPARRGGGSTLVTASTRERLLTRCRRVSAPTSTVTLRFTPPHLREGGDDESGDDEDGGGGSGGGGGGVLLEVRCGPAQVLEVASFAEYSEIVSHVALIAGLVPREADGCGTGKGGGAEDEEGGCSPPLFLRQAEAVLSAAAEARRLCEAGYVSLYTHGVSFAHASAAAAAAPALAALARGGVAYGSVLDAACRRCPPLAALRPSGVSRLHGLLTSLRQRVRCRHGSTAAATTAEAAAGVARAPVLPGVAPAEDRFPWALLAEGFQNEAANGEYDLESWVFRREDGLCEIDAFWSDQQPQETPQGGEEEELLQQHARRWVLFRAAASGGAPSQPVAYAAAASYRGPPRALPWRGVAEDDSDGSAARGGAVRVVEAEVPGGGAGAGGGAPPPPAACRSASERAASNGWCAGDGREERVLRFTSDDLFTMCPEMLDVAVWERTFSEGGGGSGGTDDGGGVRARCDVPERGLYVRCLPRCSAWRALGFEEGMRIVSIGVSHGAAATPPASPLPSTPEALLDSLVDIVHAAATAPPSLFSSPSHAHAVRGSSTPASPLSLQRGDSGGGGGGGGGSSSSGTGGSGPVSYTVEVRSAWGFDFVSCGGGGAAAEACPLAVSADRRSVSLSSDAACGDAACVAVSAVPSAPHALWGLFGGGGGGGGSGGHGVIGVGGSSGDASSVASDEYSDDEPSRVATSVWRVHISGESAAEPAEDGASLRVGACLPDPLRYVWLCSDGTVVDDLVSCGDETTHASDACFGPGDIVTVRVFQLPVGETVVAFWVNEGEGRGGGSGGGADGAVEEDEEEAGEALPVPSFAFTLGDDADNHRACGPAAPDAMRVSAAAASGETVRPAAGGEPRSPAAAAAFPCVLLRSGARGTRARLVPGEAYSCYSWVCDVDFSRVVLRRTVRWDSRRLAESGLSVVHPEEGEAGAREDAWLATSEGVAGGGGVQESVAMVVSPRGGAATVTAPRSRFMHCAAGRDAITGAGEHCFSIRVEGSTPLSLGDGDSVYVGVAPPGISFEKQFFEKTSVVGLTVRPDGAVFALDSPSLDQPLHRGPPLSAEDETRKAIVFTFRVFLPDEAERDGGCRRRSHIDVFRDGTRILHTGASSVADSALLRPYATMTSAWLLVPYVVVTRPDVKCTLILHGCGQLEPPRPWPASDVANLVVLGSGGGGGNTAGDVSGLYSKAAPVYRNARDPSLAVRVDAAGRWTLFKERRLCGGDVVPRRTPLAWADAWEADAGVVETWVEAEAAGGRGADADAGASGRVSLRATVTCRCAAAMKEARAKALEEVAMLAQDMRQDVMDVLSGLLAGELNKCRFCDGQRVSAATAGMHELRDAVGVVLARNVAASPAPADVHAAAVTAAAEAAAAVGPAPAGFCGAIALDGAASAGRVAEAAAAVLDEVSAVLSAAEEGARSARQREQEAPQQVTLSQMMETPVAAAAEKEGLSPEAASSQRRQERAAAMLCSHEGESGSDSDGGGGDRPYIHTVEVPYEHEGLETQTVSGCVVDVSGLSSELERRLFCLQLFSSPALVRTNRSRHLLVCTPSTTPSEVLSFLTEFKHMYASVCPDEAAAEAAGGARGRRSSPAAARRSAAASSLPAESPTAQAPVGASRRRAVMALYGMEHLPGELQAHVVSVALAHSVVGVLKAPGLPATGVEVYRKHLVGIVSGAAGSSEAIPRVTQAMCGVAWRRAAMRRLCAAAAESFASVRCYAQPAGSGKTYAVEREIVEARERGAAIVRVDVTAAVTASAAALRDAVRAAAESAREAGDDGAATGGFVCVTVRSGADAARASELVDSVVFLGGLSSETACVSGWAQSAVPWDLCVEYEAAPGSGPQRGATLLAVHGLAKPGELLPLCPQHIPYAVLALDFVRETLGLEMSAVLDDVVGRSSDGPPHDDDGGAVAAPPVNMRRVSWALERMGRQVARYCGILPAAAASASAVSAASAAASQDGELPAQYRARADRPPATLQNLVALCLLEEAALLYCDAGAGGGSTTDTEAQEGGDDCAGHYYQLLLRKDAVVYFLKRRTGLRAAASAAAAAGRPQAMRAYHAEQKADALTMLSPCSSPTHRRFAGSPRSTASPRSAAGGAAPSSSPLWSPLSAAYSGGSPAGSPLHRVRSPTRGTARYADPGAAMPPQLSLQEVEAGLGVVDVESAGAGVCIGVLGEAVGGVPASTVTCALLRRHGVVLTPQTFDNLLGLLASVRLLAEDPQQQQQQASRARLGSGLDGARGPSHALRASPPPILLAGPEVRGDRTRLLRFVADLADAAAAAAGGGGCGGALEDDDVVADNEPAARAFVGEALRARALRRLFADAGGVDAGRVLYAAFTQRPYEKVVQALAVVAEAEAEPAGRGVLERIRRVFANEVLGPALRDVSVAAAGQRGYYIQRLMRSNPRFREAVNHVVSAAPADTPEEGARVVKSVAAIVEALFRQNRGSAYHDGVSALKSATLRALNAFPRASSFRRSALALLASTPAATAALAWIDGVWDAFENAAGPEDSARQPASPVSSLSLFITFVKGMLGKVFLEAKGCCAAGGGGGGATGRSTRALRDARVLEALCNPATRGRAELRELAIEVLGGGGTGVTVRPSPADDGETSPASLFPRACSFVEAATHAELRQAFADAAAAPTTAFILLYRGDAHALLNDCSPAPRNVSLALSLPAASPAAASAALRLCRRQWRSIEGSAEHEELYVQNLLLYNQDVYRGVMLAEIAATAGREIDDDDGATALSSEDSTEVYSAGRRGGGVCRDSDSVSSSDDEPEAVSASARNESPTGLADGDEVAELLGSAAAAAVAATGGRVGVGVGGGPSDGSSRSERRVVLLRELITTAHGQVGTALEDVHHVLATFEVLLRVVRVSSAPAASGGGGGGGDKSGEDAATAWADVLHAMTLAVAVVYYFRLQRDERPELAACLDGVVRRYAGFDSGDGDDEGDDNDVPAARLRDAGFAPFVAAAVRAFCAQHIAAEAVPTHVHLHEGMMESVLLQVLSLHSRIPLIVAGPPGASKTLSNTLVTEWFGGGSGVISALTPLSPSPPAEAVWDEAAHAYDWGGVRPGEGRTLIQATCRYQGAVDASFARDAPSPVRHGKWEAALRMQRELDADASGGGGGGSVLVVVDEAGLVSDARSNLARMMRHAGGRVPIVFVTNHALDEDVAKDCIRLRMDVPDTEDLAAACEKVMAAAAVLRRSPAAPHAGGGAVVASALDRHVLRCACVAYVVDLQAGAAGRDGWHGLRDLLQLARCVGDGAGAAGITPALLAAAAVRNFVGPVEGAGGALSSSAYVGFLAERLAAAARGETEELFAERFAALTQPGGGSGGGGGRGDDEAEADVRILDTDVVSVLLASLAEEPAAQAGGGTLDPRYIAVVDPTDDGCVRALLGDVPALAGMAVLDGSSDDRGAFSASAAAAARPEHVLSALSDHMERGTPVWLTNPSTAVLSALYQLLDRQVITVAGATLAQVTLGTGVAEYRVVGDSFRLVVHVAATDLARYPPALLNRLEKHFVTPTDVLRFKAGLLPRTAADAGAGRLSQRGFLALRDAVGAFVHGFAGGVGGVLVSCSPTWTTDSLLLTAVQVAVASCDGAAGGGALSQLVATAAPPQAGCGGGVGADHIVEGFAAAEGEAAAGEAAVLAACFRRLTLELLSLVSPSAVLQGQDRLRRRHPRYLHAYLRRYNPYSALRFVVAVVDAATGARGPSGGLTRTVCYVPRQFDAWHAARVVAAAAVALRPHGASPVVLDFGAASNGSGSTGGTGGDECCESEHVASQLNSLRQRLRGGGAAKAAVYLVVLPPVGVGRGFDVLSAVKTAVDGAAAAGSGASVVVLQPVGDSVCADAADGPSAAGDGFSCGGGAYRFGCAAPPRRDGAKKAEAASARGCTPLFSKDWTHRYLDFSATMSVLGSATAASAALSAGQGSPRSLAAAAASTAADTVPAAAAHAAYEQEWFHPCLSDYVQRYDASSATLGGFERVQQRSVEWEDVSAHFEAALARILQGGCVAKAGQWCDAKPVLVEAFDVPGWPLAGDGDGGGGSDCLRADVSACPAERAMLSLVGAQPTRCLPDAADFVYAAVKKGAIFVPDVARVVSRLFQGGGGHHCSAVQKALLRLVRTKVAQARDRCEIAAEVARGVGGGGGGGGESLPSLLAAAEAAAAQNLVAIALFLILDDRNLSAFLCPATPPALLRKGDELVAAALLEVAGPLSFRALRTLDLPALLGQIDIVACPPLLPGGSCVRFLLEKAAAAAAAAEVDAAAPALPAAAAAASGSIAPVADISRAAHTLCASLCRSTGAEHHPVLSLLGRADLPGLYTRDLLRVHLRGVVSQQTVRGVAHLVSVLLQALHAKVFDGCADAQGVCAAHALFAAASSAGVVDGYVRALLPLAAAGVLRYHAALWQRSDAAGAAALYLKDKHGACFPVVAPPEMSRGASSPPITLSVTGDSEAVAASPMRPLFALLLEELRRAAPEPDAFVTAEYVGRALCCRLLCDAFAGRMHAVDGARGYKGFRAAASTVVRRLAGRPETTDERLLYTLSAFVYPPAAADEKAMAAAEEHCALVRAGATDEVACAALEGAATPQLAVVVSRLPRSILFGAADTVTLDGEGAPWFRLAMHAVEQKECDRAEACRVVANLTASLAAVEGCDDGDGGGFLRDDGGPVARAAARQHASAFTRELGLLHRYAKEEGSRGELHGRFVKALRTFRVPPPHGAVRSRVMEVPGRVFDIEGLVYQHLRPTVLAGAIPPVSRQDNGLVALYDSCVDVLVGVDAARLDPAHTVLLAERHEEACRQVALTAAAAEAFLAGTREPGGTIDEGAVTDALAPLLLQAVLKAATATAFLLSLAVSLTRPAEYGGSAAGSGGAAGGERRGWWPVFGRDAEEACAEALVRRVALSLLEPAGYVCPKMGTDADRALIKSPPDAEAERNNLLVLDVIEAGVGDHSGLGARGMLAFLQDQIADEGTDDEGTAVAAEPAGGGDGGDGVARARPPARSPVVYYCGESLRHKAQNATTIDTRPGDLSFVCNLDGPLHEPYVTLRSILTAGTPLPPSAAPATDDDEEDDEVAAVAAAAAAVAADGGSSSAADEDEASPAEAAAEAPAPSGAETADDEAAAALVVQKLCAKLKAFLDGGMKPADARLLLFYVSFKNFLGAGDGGKGDGGADERLVRHRYALQISRSETLKELLSLGPKQQTVLRLALDVKEGCLAAKREGGIPTSMGISRMLRAGWSRAPWSEVVCTAMAVACAEPDTLLGTLFLDIDKQRHHFLPGDKTGAALVRSGTYKIDCVTQLDESGTIASYARGQPVMSTGSCYLLWGLEFGAFAFQLFLFPDAFETIWDWVLSPTLHERRYGYHAGLTNKQFCLQQVTERSVAYHFHMGAHTGLSPDEAQRMYTILAEKCHTGTVMISSGAAAAPSASDPDESARRRTEMELRRTVSVSREYAMLVEVAVEQVWKTYSGAKKAVLKGQDSEMCYVLKLLEAYRDGAPSRPMRCLPRVSTVRRALACRPAAEVPRLLNLAAHDAAKLELLPRLLGSVVALVRHVHASLSGVVPRAPGAMLLPLLAAYRRHAPEAEAEGAALLRGAKKWWNAFMSRVGPIDFECQEGGINIFMNEESGTGDSGEWADALGFWVSCSSSPDVHHTNMIAAAVASLAHKYNACIASLSADGDDAPLLRSVPLELLAPSSHPADLILAHFPRLDEVLKAHALENEIPWSAIEHELLMESGVVLPQITVADVPNFTFFTGEKNVDVAGYVEAIDDLVAGFLVSSKDPLTLLSSPSDAGVGAALPPAGASLEALLRLGAAAATRLLRAGDDDAAELPAALAQAAASAPQPPEADTLLPPACDEPGAAGVAALCAVLHAVAARLATDFTEEGEAVPPSSDDAAAVAAAAVLDERQRRLLAAAVAHTSSAASAEAQATRALLAQHLPAMAAAARELAQVDAAAEFAPRGAALCAFLCDAYLLPAWEAAADVAACLEAFTVADARRFERAASVLLAVAKSAGSDGGAGGESAAAGDDSVAAAARRVVQESPGVEERLLLLGAGDEWEMDQWESWCRDVLDGGGETTEQCFAVLCERLGLAVGPARPDAAFCVTRDGSCVVAVNGVRVRSRDGFVQAVLEGARDCGCLGFFVELAVAV